jgi:repressor LexA
MLHYVERNLANKVYPTQKEMAEHFGVSQHVIYQRLNSLRKKGYLENCSFRRGTYLSKEYLASKEKSVGLPILGRVVTRTPILAEKNITGYMDLNSFIKKAHKNAFILKTVGDSMFNDNVNSGDYVIVKPQSTVENGQIGVAVIENEATVKRIFIKAGKIILKPANRKYKEMVYKRDDENVSIIGIVIGCFRRF